MSTFAQRDIVDEVLAERAAQDRKWGGEQHDDDHERDDWVRYLRQHVNKAETADIVGDLDSHRKQLVRVAALAMAAVESFDRKVKP